TAQATDKDGATGVATAAVSVQGVPPTAVIVGGDNAAEGSVIAFTAEASDPSSAGTAAGVSYAWSATEGNPTLATGSASDFSFTAANDGTVVVSLTVTDKDGLSGTESRVVTVTNVAPTVESLVVSPSAIAVGDTVVLSGMVVDPGLLDTHRVDIQWGDNTSD